MRTNKYQSPAYFHAKDLGCLVCIEELKQSLLIETSQMEECADWKWVTFLYSGGVSYGMVCLRLGKI